MNLILFHLLWLLKTSAVEKNKELSTHHSAEETLVGRGSQAGASGSQWFLFQDFVPFIHTGLQNRLLPKIMFWILNSEWIECIMVKTTTAFSSAKIYYLIFLRILNNTGFCPFAIFSISRLVNIWTSSLTMCLHLDLCCMMQVSLCEWKCFWSQMHSFRSMHRVWVFSRRVNSKSFLCAIPVLFPEMLLTDRDTHSAGRGKGGGGGEDVSQRAFPSFSFLFDLHEVTSTTGLNNWWERVFQ